MATNKIPVIFRTTTESFEFIDRVSEELRISRLDFMTIVLKCEYLLDLLPESAESRTGELVGKMFYFDKTFLDEISARAAEKGLSRNALMVQMVRLAETRVNINLWKERTTKLLLKTVRSGGRSHTSRKEMIHAKVSGLLISSLGSAAEELEVDVGELLTDILLAHPLIVKHVHQNAYKL